MDKVTYKGEGGGIIGVRPLGPFDEIVLSSQIKIVGKLSNPPQTDSKAHMRPFLYFSLSHSLDFFMSYSLKFYSWFPFKHMPNSYSVINL